MHQVLSIVAISTILVLFLPLPISSSAGYRSIRSKPKDADRNKPRNILVEVVNSTSIYLQWDPPKESVLEQCPVLRYMIRLKTEGARKSRTWKIDGALQSVTLHDLVVGSTYYVRLLAVVCDGKGKPSRWLRVRTTNDDSPSSTDNTNDARERQTPSKPTYVRTRTFPDSVIVSWLPPEDDTVVRGYMVGYGEGVPDVNWQYVDATRKNVTIRNLKPATQYIVSLRAFNNFGKGPVVYDLIYTRDQSASTVGPASTPIDLKVKVLSPTTVWLQWSDPSLGRVQQLTDNRYYNVHYQPTTSSSGGGSPSSTGKTLSVIVKAFHVVLYDLLPGTRYEFKVRMVKDAQASPFSEAIANKTFETAPSSPPRGLSVQPTNVSGSIILSWRPPRLPNGDITGYLVLFSHDLNLTVDKWQVQSVAGHDLSTSISGLASNKTYHFKVQGRNSNGHSPLSSTTSHYTKPNTNTGIYPASSFSSSSSSSPSPPSVLSSIRGSSANATTNTSRQAEHSTTRGRADEGDDEAEDATGTSPPSQEDDEEDDEDYNYDGGSEESNGLESAALLGEQLPSTSKAKREPLNEKVAPLVSGSEHLRDTSATPPSVHFRSIVQYHVSAYITWPDTLSKCNGAWPVPSTVAAPVTGYLFRYAPHGGASSQPERYISRNLTNNFVLVDDLAPDSTYRYQVKYLFRGGVQSSWSGESTVDTHYKGKEKL